MEWRTNRRSGRGASREGEKKKVGGQRQKSVGACRRPVEQTTLETDENLGFCDRSNEQSGKLATTSPEDSTLHLRFRSFCHLQISYTVSNLVSSQLDVVSTQSHIIVTSFIMQSKHTGATHVLHKKILLDRSGVPHKRGGVKNLMGSIKREGLNDPLTRPAEESFWSSLGSRSPGENAKSVQMVDDNAWTTSSLNLRSGTRQWSSDVSTSPKARPQPGPWVWARARALPPPRLLLHFTEHKRRSAINFLCLSLLIAL
ncbi:hypothetical protein RUM44_007999 [Polyplax serrata]|uniref:Uncharacterized protein n=1 Tax=Polyplax serrata TaxID=468196 RepID=A0ABR1BB68_POLSC